MHNILPFVGKFSSEITINFTYSDRQQEQTENDYQMMNEEGGSGSGDEHEYHVLEEPGGNTHVHQNRELERREVKESREEHDYHVLEGPGGDGASKETGVSVVGEVIDYEIPLPLKN